MTRLSDALAWRKRADDWTAEQWDSAGWDLDAAYSVSSDDYGIAWHVIGPEIEPDSDTEWSGYERATGRVCMVMIGDDRLFAFDPAEVRAIDDLAYCASCGQIGCTADGRDRSDDGTDVLIHGVGDGTTVLYFRCPTCGTMGCEQHDDTAARPAEMGGSNE